MRTINEIIIHCSATTEGKDYTVADITRWHKNRGFRTIGYHYVIYRDGSIHTGRPLNEIGAHCLGHNKYSIGVCYIGGVATDNKSPKDTRTPEQKEALVKLLKDLHKRFPKATIHGHREFVAKACPSFDVKEYKNLFFTVLLASACLFFTACKSTQKTLEEKKDNTMMTTSTSSNASLATDWFMKNMAISFDSIVFNSMTLPQMPHDTEENGFLRKSWGMDDKTNSEDARLLPDISRTALPNFFAQQQRLLMGAQQQRAAVAAATPEHRATLPKGATLSNVTGSGMGSPLPCPAGTQLKIYGLRLQSKTADSSSKSTVSTANISQHSSYHSNVKAKVKKVPSIRWTLSVIAIAAMIIAAIALFIRKRMMPP